MLSETEIAQAKTVLQRLASPIRVEIDAGSETNDPFSQNLRAIAASLAEAASGKLEVAIVDSDGSSPTPSLSVGNVRYLAVPEGPELPPFLDFMVAKAQAASETIDSGAPVKPAEMTLFIAPACPNCPKVAAICLDLASRNPELALSIVDAQQFPELAGTCRSVPMLTIDRVHTLVGQTSKADLLAILQHRDDPDSFERALSAMIDAGRHKEAATELCSEAGLRALPRLLAVGTLQQRMGVMMTVEEALDDDPHALDDALPHLLPLAGTDDTTVRGDLADLLGQIGAPDARDVLERLAKDENEDVREIAEESLTMLRA